ncbi:MAG: amidohydrolase, partial [Actinomycetota bacterium]
MSLLPSDLRVIDCDTHLTEPHDLWVKRAPAAFKDRVPRVVEIDGRASWVVDDKVLGFAGGGGVIDTEGAKHSFGESMMVWGIDRIHRGAWDPEARIEVMNDSGVHAQVLFPNAVGFGEGLSSSEIDPVLRLLSIQIYNDAMAEMQSDSGNRLLPMPI